MFLKKFFPQKNHFKNIFKKIAPTKKRENFLNVSKNVSYNFRYKKQSFSN